MARENQGLQIALIIFVMLFVILSVTTFLFFRQADEASRAAAEAQQKATESENTARKIQDDFNTLKGYTGFAATEAIDTIGEQFRGDMQKFAPSLPEPQWSYKAVVEDQDGRIQALSESLASAEAANQQLQATIEQLEASKAPLVAEQENRAQKAEAEVASLRTTYNDARSTLQQQQQKQYKGYVEQLDKEKKAREDLETQITGQQTRIQDLEELLKEKNKKIIDIIEPTFETADGKIRWVNQRNQTVWVNLGRADALQRLTSFSVYPADTSDVTKVGKKASIEVTQVLGDHLAEARIVEDQPNDPIMPGDVIHTPVWAPGEREHFALTDGMDTDDDGKSDLQTVIQVITMNGGVVDVYVTDDGERKGQFTNRTRYLVMGSAPDELSTEARRNARRDILNDAEQRGLTKITLKDLLDKMGWKNQTPVVQFGRGANANQFRAQPPEGGLPVSRGTVSPLFQPRQPPAGSRGSAY